MANILSQDEINALLTDMDSDDIGFEESDSDPIVSSPSIVLSNISDIKDENIRNLLDVKIEIVVLYGRKKIDISSMIGLKEGKVLELDKLQNEPVEILVNGSNVAMGELIVVDGVYSVRLSNLVSPEARLKSLKTR